MKTHILVGLLFIVLLCAVLLTETSSPRDSEHIKVETPRYTKSLPESIKTPPKKPTQTIIIDNTYIIRYAGVYIIEIEGVNSDDIEKYILKPDGVSIWKWESGPYPDTKYGTWTAEKGKIKTMHKGRTGNIPEEFTYRNGKFRSEWGDDRILVKIKDL